MSSRIVTALLIAVVAVAAILLQCSKKDKGTNPPPSVVEMSGRLDTTILSGIPLDQVTITHGANVSSADTAGGFTVKGNTNTPGLVMAADANDKVLLMKIVSDPANKSALEMNVHSTAQAIVFLHPFVCIADPIEAAGVLSQIDVLPEFQNLETYLDSKMQSDPRGLNLEDSQLDSLVSRTILAYVETYPSQLSKLLGIEIPIATNKLNTALETPPEIEPIIERGGLKLTYEGSDKFRIWNSLCRWAFCTTPTDSFMIFPSGDFLDLIKNSGTPWPPSKRDFTMHVTPGGDTSRINIYGYGFLFLESNKWHDLSMQERNWAHVAGLATIIFELGRHTLGVVTNIAVPLAGDRIAPLVRNDLSLFSFFYTELNNAARLDQYINNNDPWGASYWVIKLFFTRLISSADYREAFYSITGIALTQQALLGLGKWVALPLKAAVAFNSVSQGFRAALGFERSFFRTSFKVWKEYTEFGNIEANVGDKQTGHAIEGVVVTVIGDDNNPMNPAHELTTDASGFVRFTNIGTGERTLQASKTGYNGKSVAVTVEKDKTVSVDIVMERQSGGLSGKVLNDILVHHGVSPAYFKGTVDINANEIGGQHRSANSSAFDGPYNITLPLGSWWVIASHEDYKPDSFSITVSADGAITAPRDLLLKPDPKMTGEVYVNTDNSGSYEVHFVLNLPQVGLRKPTLYADECYEGGQKQLIMDAAGVRGSSNSDFDFFQIIFNSAQIEQAGDYRASGIEYFGCTGHSAPATAAFGTSRTQCLYEQIIHSPMLYSLFDDPDSYGCNCGASLTQSIFLTDWGTELGDVVAGTCVLDLAGWNTCECGGNDTNDDGKIDSWDVSCSQARVDVDFRLLVGTEYLVTFTPSGSRVFKGSDVPK